MSELPFEEESQKIKASFLGVAIDGGVACLFFTIVLASIEIAGPEFSIFWWAIPLVASGFCAVGTFLYKHPISEKIVADLIADNNNPAVQAKTRRVNWIVGLICVVTAIGMVASQLTWRHFDPHWETVGLDEIIAQTNGAVKAGDIHDVRVETGKIWVATLLQFDYKDQTLEVLGPEGKVEPECLFPDGRMEGNQLILKLSSHAAVDEKTHERTVGCLSRMLLDLDARYEKFFGSQPGGVTIHNE